MKSGRNGRPALIFHDGLVQQGVKRERGSSSKQQAHLLHCSKREENGKIKMEKSGQTRELYLQDKQYRARARRLYNPLAIGPQGSNTVPAHRWETSARWEFRRQWLYTAQEHEGLAHSCRSYTEKSNGRWPHPLLLFFLPSLLLSTSHLKNSGHTFVYIIHVPSHFLEDYCPFVSGASLFPLLFTQHSKNFDRARLSRHKKCNCRIDPAWQRRAKDRQVWRARLEPIRWRATRDEVVWRNH